MSKIDSFKEILQTWCPEVVVLCEVKQKNPELVKNFFKKLGYYPLYRKESGLLIAAKIKHKLVETTCSPHNNILTGRLTIHDSTIRIVAVYGLQETCNASERDEFFEEVSAEIESCKAHGDDFIISGDFNAKLDSDGDNCVHLSSNGKHLCEIIDNYSLKVLNSHPCCTGKWTRVRNKKGTVERSVLDYILANSTMYDRVSSVLIDEERLLTPFSITKRKGATTRISTDHNTILAKFWWSREQKISNQEERKCPKNLGWKLSPEGLTEFTKITTEDLHNVPQDYEQMEQYLSNTMDRCFKRKHPPKVYKNPNYQIHKKPLLKTFNVLKPFLQAGRTEKAAAMEYIKLLQKIQLETVQQSRTARVQDTLEKLQTENTKDFNINKFWKLKKCVSAKSDSKTSIISENGVELFDDPAILNEYVKEFKKRLSHKTISPDLAAFQDVSHKLLNMYLSKASSVAQDPFTESEVDAVFATSKTGKSCGNDLFPPDILPHAGPMFVKAVTNALNNIKANLTIPDSWIDVIITTLYKNKGSRKILRNHRGIFLTSIFSKVMEKLIKTRIQNKLKNITPFQCSAPNHSTADSMFIVNGLIDHAKYQKTPLYLTLYDYSTCFDSLWLEDTMLSLWDLGVQDEMLPLIYKLNEHCDITMRTPYGTSLPFKCERIVKQGAVLSTSLCGSSTSQLTKELDQLLDCGANILDAQIKAILFVDDTITANTNVIGALKSHEHFMRFSRRKRLSVNGTKCVLVIINSSNDIPPPVLYVDGVEIQVVPLAKYLGDIISANGSNDNLIQDRVKKGKAIIISALSLCNDLTLGHHYLSSALLLYKVIFLAAVLFNSQAWTNITKSQIKQLTTIQLKYLKRTLQVPNSTPNAFTFLELGVLPIEYEIHRRQLMFLHHIHTLPVDDPVNKVFQQQKLLPNEKNWWNHVSNLLSQYDLSNSDYSVKSKEEWKTLVNTAVNEYAFTKLKQECSNMTKTYHLKYEVFERQSYISTCSSNIAKLIFRIRCKMMNCRDNHHRSNPNTICRLCQTHIETQNHIINCKKVCSPEDIISLQTYMSANFEIDINQLQKIESRYEQFHELCSS